MRRYEQETNKQHKIRMYNIKTDKIYLNIHIYKNNAIFNKYIYTFAVT